MFKSQKMLLNLYSSRLLPKFPVQFRLSLLWLVCIAILLVICLPVIYLLLRGAENGIAGLEYLVRPRTLTIFLNSALLTALVVTASGIIGVSFAWLTTRAKLPFRRLILILGLLPMVIPSYIGALTLVAVFGPVGHLQQLLQPLGVQRLPDIYGLFGAVFALTLFTYPYFALPVRAALLNMDSSLEEAAQSMGCSRWEIFRRVTFPVLRPAILAGATLTALYTLSDFGAVMVMRYNAFSRAIYVAYNSSFDRSRAALLALVLVCCTLLLTWLERRITQSMHTYRIGKGSPRALTQTSLGRWRYPAVLFVGLLIIIGVILPVIILLGWAANPRAISPIDMQLQESSSNALTASGITALVVALVALPLAIVARRTASGFKRTFIALSYTGNALPGIVIGLALVFFSANALPVLYQTLPLLVLGYTIRFLPYGIASTQNAMSAISPGMDEAAQSLGLNPLQSLLRVTLPLVWSGIVAGMGLTFLNSMKELPTTLMLAPIGFNTPATRIWMASESGQLSLIGMPGLVLITLSCLGLAILLWRESRLMDRSSGRT